MSRYSGNNAKAIKMTALQNLFFVKANTASRHRYAPKAKTKNGLKRIKNTVALTQAAV